MTAIVDWIRIMLLLLFIIKDFGYKLIEFFLLFDLIGQHINEFHISVQDWSISIIVLISNAD